jgi:hypothetical protein
MGNPLDESGPPDVGVGTLLPAFRAVSGTVASQTGLAYCGK